MKQFMKKVLGKRSICGALAILLVVSTVVNPLSMLPAYATGDWLQLSYQYNEKSDLELYVQAEDGKDVFAPGEDVVLNLFVQNNSEQVLEGRGLSWKNKTNGLSDGEFILLDEDEDGAPEINENGNVVNLSLDPNEIYALQFVGTVNEDLDLLKERQISFRFGAEYLDENGEATGNTVTTETSFQFTTGLVEGLTIDIDEAELVAGETDTLEVQMVLADIGYYYETSDDSEAAVASDSDADVASDSDADEDDDEEDYTFEINNIKFKLDTYGAKFENVTLLEATATASNAVINAAVEYQVAEDTAAGAYFGTLGVEVKSGGKTYDVENGFCFTVVEASEAGTAKHLDTCDEGCTGEGCNCACHEKARELIAKVEGLLAEAQTFTEETDYEVMYAVYDSLFALPDEMDAAWDNGELTEAEYYYVQEFVNTNAVTIIELLTAVGFDPYAIMLLADYSYTIAVGESLTLFGNQGSNHSWTSDVQGIVSWDNSGQNITVSGIKVGEVTVTHRYKSKKQWNTQTYYIKVVDSDEPIKVYVYVGTNAGNDANGNTISWADNEEFLELLGIGADTVDNNKFFPVGEIYLERSYLNGKEDASNQVGVALINSEDDWAELLSALSEMNTQTLTGKYAANIGNNVPDYLDQAAADINAGMGSQKTALFRWNMTTSYGFDDQTVQFHLDLRFSTNKITFITGNNGITSGNAKDGTAVDTRAYITGSEIQKPRNLYIPDGYKFMGYYTDADFTTPWDGIGTPLDEDQVVYIKITPKANVIIYYVNVTGDEAGSLSLDSEGFNPETGAAIGSNASANVGYKFDGWYADEACTELLSEDIQFTPPRPTEGWDEGTVYYYYAKFEPIVQKVIVEKKVSGTWGDWNQKFDFTITINDSNGNLIDSQSFTLTHLGTKEFDNLPIGAIVTVTEEDNDYTTTYTIEQGDNSLIDESNDKGDRQIKITLIEGENIKITFNNNKEAEIDTGITMDSIPYILILAAVIGGIAFYVIRKRKETDLD